MSGRRCTALSDKLTHVLQERRQPLRPRRRPQGRRLQTLSLRRRSLQLHLHAARRGAGRTALPEVLPWTGPRAAVTAWTPPATWAAMQVGSLGCLSLHLVPGSTVLPAVIALDQPESTSSSEQTPSHLGGDAVGLPGRVGVHAGLKWTALPAGLFVSLTTAILILGATMAAKEGTLLLPVCRRGVDCCGSSAGLWGLCLGGVCGGSKASEGQQHPRQVFHWQSLAGRLHAAACCAWRVARQGVMRL